MAQVLRRRSGSGRNTTNSNTQLHRRRVSSLSCDERPPFFSVGPSVLPPPSTESVAHEVNVPAAASEWSEHAGEGKRCRVRQRPRSRVSSYDSDADGANDENRAHSQNNRKQPQRCASHKKRQSARLVSPPKIVRKTEDCASFRDNDGRGEAVSRWEMFDRRAYGDVTSKSTPYYSLVDDTGSHPDTDAHASQSAFDDHVHRRPQGRKVQHVHNKLNHSLVSSFIPSSSYHSHFSARLLVIIFFATRY